MSSSRNENLRSILRSSNEPETATWVYKQLQTCYDRRHLSQLRWSESRLQWIPVLSRSQREIKKPELRSRRAAELVFT